MATTNDEGGMEKATVFYAKHDGLVVLKLVGPFAFSLGSSKTLDTFINELFLNDDYENVLIDMTETTSIDSTNLGLLAIMTRVTMDLHERRATIISTNDDINEILDSVGFGDVFHIVHDPHGVDAEFEELSGEGDPSSRALTQVVLNAHKELLGLNKQNETMFKDVVELLELQMGEDEG